MTRSRSSFPLPAFAVERKRGISMERQVYLSLRQAITDGRLRPGVRLPSTRELAATLGVSRTVVLSAFQRLVTEGFISSRVGSGTIVLAERVRRSTGPAIRRPRTSRWAHIAETLDVDAPGAGTLAPGAPAVDLFPSRRWTQMVARSWRDASSESARTAPQGLMCLRAAIADYAGCMRNIVCTADDVIITAGACHALHAIARIFSDPGEAVIVEDPCPPMVRTMYEAADLLPIGWPVDEQGIVVDPGSEIRARIIHVTPSAHDPLGYAMSGGRRYQVLQWAASHDAVIVEHDADFGLSTSAPAMPLKFTDTQGCVVYVSSFAGAMLPSIDLGFIVAARPLMEALTRAQRFFGRAPSVAEQRAMADFLSEGDYARHLRRLGPAYDERRAELHTELQRQLGWAIVRILPGRALQSIVWLRDDIDDKLVVKNARERGICPAALSTFSTRAPQNGLVLGFGSTPPARMKQAVGVLADVIAQIARS